MTTVDILTLDSKLKEVYDLIIKLDEPTIFKTEDGKEYKVNMSKSAFMTFDISFFKINDTLEVKQSSVHQRGVFATADIPKDSVVTFYPCDICCYIPDGNRESENHVVLPTLSPRFAKKIPIEYVKDEYDRLWDYSCDINDHYTIFGDFTCDKDTSSLGHLINDSFKGDFSILSPTLYQALSRKRANCRFQNIGYDNFVAVLANRDIKAGEELYVSYGIGYWTTYCNKMGIHNRKS